MQTFLPFADFEKSLQHLDWKRLGKQRVEALEIVKVIEGRPRKDGKPYIGWKNHPCVIMWQNYVSALKLYHNLCILEWTGRGYKNTMPLFDLKEKEVEYPSWLGFERFHASHRANLLRKDQSYYSKYDWKERPSDVYLWLDENNRWYHLRSGTRERKYLTNL
jgi:hypothetical protein